MESEPAPVPRTTQRRWLLAVWRSPLARSSDRAESAAGLLLLTLWLLSLPIIAVAGSLWWSDISVTVAEQQRDRLQITAVQQTDAADFVISSHGVPLTEEVPVTGTWKAPDGTERTGTLLVAAGSPAGSPQSVWVDRSGTLVDAPMTQLAAAILVLMGATVGWLCWGVLLHGARQLLRYRLNGQRLAAWESEWQLVEPLWSGRQQR